MTATAARRRAVVKSLWISGAINGCVIAFDLYAGVTASTPGGALFDYGMAGFIAAVWGLTARLSLRRR